MTDFLSRVATDIVERFGNDLSKIAIVFNNQRPQKYLKQYLAQRIGKAFWSPRFFTIQDFFRSSTDRTEASFIQQVLLLNRLHNEFQRKDNPAFDESLDQFFPVAEVILGDFAQLDYEMAPVRRVFLELSEQALLDQQFEFLTEEQRELLSRFWAAYTLGKESQLNARFLKLWNLLPELYDGLRRALQNEGSQSMAGIYRDLAEQQTWTHDVAQDYDKVLFVGFNALNACEATLFKRWQDEGKALFYFDADPYYTEDKGMEAGFFIRRNLGLHGLQNALGDFAPQIQPLPGSGSGKQIQVIAAPGHQAQAKLLAQLLTSNEFTKVGGADWDSPKQRSGDLASSGSPSAGQIAVILADESLLIPVLQSIPSELEVNVTMGYPMRSSMTHSLIELYAEIQLSLRTHRSLLPTTTDAFGAPNSAHALEGFENRIARIPSTLLLDLVSHPFSFCSKDARRCVMQGEALDPKDQERIAQFCNPVNSYKDFLSGLDEILQQRLSEFAPSYLMGRIEMKLIELALQALRQFRSGIEEGEDFSIALCVRLLRRIFAKISASLPGDPLSGIQVMGLLESRNLSFETIYLLGANEGILPSPHASSSFIPYNIRRAFGLPVVENQQALTAYLFYRLLHRVDQFFVLYNGIVEGGKSGELSRFVRQLKYESQLHISDLEVSLRSHGHEEATSLPVERVERVERVEGVGRVEHKGREERFAVAKTGEVWKALERYLLDSSAPEKRYLSASAFTLYLNSPLEFFYKYIAGIKEPPEQETDIRPNQLGTVIHGVMEKLYAPYLSSQLTLGAYEIQALKGKLKATCLSVLYEQMYGVATDTVTTLTTLKSASNLPVLTSQDKIILRLSETYCGRYLEHDAKLGARIRLIELENDKDYLLDFPISVGGDPNNQATVTLKGIIDRVDEVAGQRRIVDYKTGGDSLDVTFSQFAEDGQPLVDFFKTNWKDSNKAFIQTLFYTYVYEQKRGVTGVEPHLYAVRRMDDNGTKFVVKWPRRESIPVEGQFLERVKQEFIEFMRRKLEELFDPNIPFVHPIEATMYTGNYLADFLQYNPMPDDDDE